MPVAALAQTSKRTKKNQKRRVILIPKARTAPNPAQQARPNKANLPVLVAIQKPNPDWPPILHDVCNLQQTNPPIFPFVDTRGKSFTYKCGQTFAHLITELTAFPTITSTSLPLQRARRTPTRRSNATAQQLPNTAGDTAFFESAGSRMQKARPTTAPRPGWPPNPSLAQ